MIGNLEKSAICCCGSLAVGRLSTIVLANLLQRCACRWEHWRYEWIRRTEAMGLGGVGFCSWTDNILSPPSIGKWRPIRSQQQKTQKLYLSGGLVHWCSCLEAIRVFKVIIEPVLVVVAECWDFDFRFRSTSTGSRTARTSHRTRPRTTRDDFSDTVDRAWSIHQA